MKDYAVNIDENHRLLIEDFQAYTRQVESLYMQDTNIKALEEKLDNLKKTRTDHIKEMPEEIVTLYNRSKIVSTLKGTRK